MQQRIWVVFLFVSFLFSGNVYAENYTVTIDGLVCDFCARGIKKKLSKQFSAQKIKDIEVDLDAKTVRFHSDPVDDQQIKDAIADAGYTVKAIEIGKPQTK